MTEDPGDKLKTQEPPEADGPSVTNPEVGDDAPMPEATEVDGTPAEGLDGPEGMSAVEGADGVPRVPLESTGVTVTVYCEPPTSPASTALVTEPGGEDAGTVTTMGAPPPLGTSFTT